MNARKLVVIEIFILLLVTSTILTSCGGDNMHSKKPSINFFELIGNESIDDICLTIYYISPSVLTRFPWTVDNLIDSHKYKVVVDGNSLEEHLDLFKQISNDDLVPVKKKSSLDARIYYVLESKKHGTLFDVVMWGGNDDGDSIYVNGFEVKGNDIFYDVIIPFLPDGLAQELREYAGF